MFKYSGLLLVFAFISQASAASNMSVVSTKPENTLQIIVPCIRDELTTAGKRIIQDLQTNPVTTIGDVVCGQNTIDNLMKSLHTAKEKTQNCVDFTCYLPTLPTVVGHLVSTYLKCVAEFKKKGPRAFLIHITYETINKCIIAPYA